MYAKNLMALLQHLISDGELRLDFTDEITHGACVTHAGEIRHELMRQAIMEAQTAAVEQEGNTP
jgi:NAD(P) transhydrogenase subunit alpha